MTQDIESNALPTAGSPGAEVDPPGPLPLSRLALSLVLIVLCATAMACLVAVLVLLALYADLGADGVGELYQNLRFDLAFKTEVGAAVVGTFYASVAAATVGAALWYGGRRWRSLVAWNAPRGRRWTVIMICAATLVYAASATVFLIVTQHRPVISVDGPTNFVLLGAFATNLVIMAPCAEELFFRGWLYTGLRAHLSFWPSLLTTALLFAAIHLDSHRPRVLLVLPLAVAVGFVRELTGSVKPAIALHVAYNLVIVVIRLWET